MVALRKENVTLQGTLRRYRLMIQQMSQKKKALPHNSVNMLDNVVGHKSVVSMSQANTMNKSASGSSLVTAGAPNPSNASAIDQVKLERVMAMFSRMSTSDNICSMILIVMQELRQLIPAASIAFFVVNEEHSKDLQDLETLS